MAKYRKKPVVVDAELYAPGMEDGYKTFDTRSPDPLERPWFVTKTAYDQLLLKPTVLCPVIKTLEGWIEVSPGDYVITGVNGERYPCKPDIFAKTYEEAADDTVGISPVFCPKCEWNLKLNYVGEVYCSHCDYTKEAV